MKYLGMSYIKMKLHIQSHEVIHVSGFSIVMETNSVTLTRCSCCWTDSRFLLRIAFESGGGESDDVIQQYVRIIAKQQTYIGIPMPMIATITITIKLRSC